MKVVYSDVFVSILDRSVKGLLCHSASNGITFTVSAEESELPPCAGNKTENITDLTITEINCEGDFINIYGYTNDDPLIIIRVHSLVLNSVENNEHWEELILEAGLTDNIPGVFVAEKEMDMYDLASRINHYLIINDQVMEFRA